MRAVREHNVENGGRAFAAILDEGESIEDMLARAQAKLPGFSAEPIGVDEDDNHMILLCELHIWQSDNADPGPDSPADVHKRLTEDLPRPIKPHGWTDWPQQWTTFRDESLTIVLNDNHCYTIVSNFFL